MSKSFRVRALIQLSHFRNFSCAARYLPTDTVLTDDGQLQSPSPVSCYLGPYGCQTRVEIAMFDSHATCMLHYSTFWHHQLQLSCSQQNMYPEASLSCSMPELQRGAQTGARPIQTTGPVRQSAPSPSGTCLK